MTKNNYGYIKSKVSKNKLLNMIMEYIHDNDFNSLMSMNIKIKDGWEFILISPITDILYDQDMAFISQSFSDKSDQLTVQDVINKLGEYPEYNHYPIVFEIYAYDGKTNEQIVIDSDISESDIKFIRDNNSLRIEVSVDKTKAIMYRKII